MIYRRVFDVPRYGWQNMLSELDGMRRRMDRLFGEQPGRPFFAPQAGVFPLLNLTEDKDNYYVRAELPGMQADEIEIQATGTSISISGERKISMENEGAKYHRRERDAGKFSRKMDMPEPIDAEKVEASLVNGILTLVIPKSEHAKPRQIEVK